jgi:hypothetical protein
MTKQASDEGHEPERAGCLKKQVAEGHLPKEQASAKRQNKHPATRNHQKPP